MSNPSFVFVFSSSSQFQPIGANNSSFQFCSPDIGMFDSGDQVSFPAANTTPSTPVQLPPPGSKTSQSVCLYPSNSAAAQITVIKGKKPTLEFAVCDGTGNYSAYVLCGLALQSGGAADVKEFPKVEIDASTNKVSTSNDLTILSVTDNHDNDSSYKFFVLVQQVSTGQIGLIDPRIVNQH